jgi:hypothetical protein
VTRSVRKRGYPSRMKAAAAPDEVSMTEISEAPIAYLRNSYPARAGTRCHGDRYSGLFLGRYCLDRMGATSAPGYTASQPAYPKHRACGTSSRSGRWPQATHQSRAIFCDSPTTALRGGRPRERLVRFDVASFGRRDRKRRSRTGSRRRIVVPVPEAGVFVRILPRSMFDL